MESVEEPVKEDADDFGDFDGFTAAPALASASGPDPVSPPVLAADPVVESTSASLEQTIETTEHVEAEDERMVLPRPSVPDLEESILKFTQSSTLSSVTEGGGSTSI